MSAQSMLLKLRAKVAILQARIRDLEAEVDELKSNRG